MSQNEICPVCMNVFYKEGKKKKSEETCAKDNCEENCVLGSDLCVTHTRQRYPITCLSCNKSCCRLCYITFFLNAEEDATKCIHCEKQFDLEYLLGEDEKYKQRFSSTFVWTELKEHREKILLEQIMAKMPYYQRIVAAKIKVNEYSEKVKEIDEKIKNLRQEKDNILTLLVEQKRIYSSNDFEELKKKEVTYLTRGKCPKQNCNGYIEEKWECGICRTKICSQCMLEKLDGHECDENDVQSTQLIRDSTKPCPNCRIRIFRSEGCSQMWCTNCHVFFCWNSGKIIEKTAYVHNPHYIEFQRQNGIIGNNAHNREGGGCFEINVGNITELNLARSIEKILINYIAKANHILGNIQGHRQPIENKNKEAAVQFLNGKITKEELAVYVQKFDKASRKEELANLRRTTYANTIKDIITMCYFEIIKNDSIENKKNLERIVLQEKQEEEEEDITMDGDEEVHPNFKIEERVNEIVKKSNKKAVDTCIKRLTNLDEYTKTNMETIGKLFKSCAPDISLGFIENDYRRRW